MIDDQTPFRSLPRAGRRERIVAAAKRVFLDKGLDAASMDDVAAQAGTTKPTVYAHFASKDELFEAVVAYIKGLTQGVLGGPDPDLDPVEAVARFCARVLDIQTWTDPIAFHRVALSATPRNPALARATFDAQFADAARTLAGYLRDRNLSPEPDRDADLILAMTALGPFLRHLYGVDAPTEMPADRAKFGHRVDLAPIRSAVRLVAAGWAWP